MKKVSVLVAVYNAEEYLRECLDSLVNQTYKNIEVLCVDDASTDGSLNILQEYAAKDKRFRVYHLDKNSGPCKVRNIALQYSTGDLVCFLDADDWMDSDSIEKAVAVFDDNEQTDSVLFRCVYSYDNGRQEDYPMPEFGVKNGKEAFVDSLTWRIHGIYMIRGDIHRQYPYDDSDNAFNDENVTRIHYLKSREVRMTDGVYHYRMHSTSVTHKASCKKVLYVNTCEDMMRKLVDMKCDDEILTAYENQRWLMFVDCYMHYYNYGNTFSADERALCRDVLMRVWKGIESARLSKVKYKFGYMPLQCSFALFELQERMYFGLRNLMGR